MRNLKLTIRYDGTDFSGWQTQPGKRTVQEVIENAIREITLEGPGAGGIETASAVVADLVSIVGTTGTGFLQGDPVWRQVERMPSGEPSGSASAKTRRLASLAPSPTTS